MSAQNVLVDASTQKEAKAGTEGSAEIEVVVDGIPDHIFKPESVFGGTSWSMFEGRWIGTEPPEGITIYYKSDLADGVHKLTAKDLTTFSFRELSGHYRFSPRGDITVSVKNSPGGWVHKGHFDMTYDDHKLDDGKPVIQLKGKFEVRSK
jgi:hypothetical protein